MVEPRLRPGRPARPPRRRSRGPLPLPSRPPRRRRRAARARRHGGDPLGRRPRRPRHRRRLRPPPRPRAPWPPACGGSGCRCSRPRPSPRHAHHVARRRGHAALLPGLRAAPLARLGAQTASAAAHHLQLLLVQRPDGGLTIGDTHAYDEPFDFALCRGPDRRAPRPGRANPRHGAPAGAAPLGGRVRRSASTAPSASARRSSRRVAGHGPGRSRHDVFPGHRRRHARGGGRALA